MTTPQLVGDVDPVRASDWRELAAVADGPCVSVLMPTHRAGPQTRQDPIRLRNLLDEARAELESAGIPPASADELLAPHVALLEDGEFWRHQAEGLALYASAGLARRFRVPLGLAEEVFVGPGFRIRPLARLAAGDGPFYVLALSQNQVRLFEATRTTMTELPLGTIPSSMVDALELEERERQRQLQLRSTGGRGVQFHGHGAGTELDKQELEQYFRAVDDGLHEQLGGRPAPLVLAAVAYYPPIYRSVSRWPSIADGCVEGNPEPRRPEALHAEAWPLVEAMLAEDQRGALRRLREASTARTASDPCEVLELTREGRVEALFASEGPPVWGSIDPATGRATAAEGPAPGRVDVVDRALAEAMLHDTDVHVVDQTELATGTPVAALRRY